MLSKINTRSIRILLRAGLVSLALTPAFYFQGQHIIFAPAWAVLVSAFICGVRMDFFLYAITPILIIWILGFLFGTLISKSKQQDREEG